MPRPIIVKILGIRVPSGGGTGTDTDAAHLSEENVFTNLNTFTGVRFSTKTVTIDYTLTELDFEVLVDAVDDDLEILLPPSLGTGQLFRVKKIDSSNHIVAIIADGTDLIDGSISVNLDTQWADCMLVDAAEGYWDNTGGLESLFTPVGSTPTTLNEVIAAGSSLGFWP